MSISIIFTNKIISHRESIICNVAYSIWLKDMEGNIIIYFTIFKTRKYSICFMQYFNFIAKHYFFRMYEELSHSIYFIFLQLTHQIMFSWSIKVPVYNFRTICFHLSRAVKGFISNLKRMNLTLQVYNFI